MTQFHDIRGASIPFFAYDYTYEDISAVNFDPITTNHDANHVHPTAMTDEHMIALYEKNGFLVRTSTVGLIYVITWAQYKRSLSAGMT